MRIIRKLFFLISCCLLFSCTKEKLDADEYIAYVENESNSFVHQKQIGDLVFQLQYCPTEYLVVKELNTQKIPQAFIDKKIKENNGLLFFKLRIKTGSGADVLHYNIASDEDYYHRIDYLSYGFEEDVALINDKDTIFPGTFLFERTYGISPNADFVLMFDSKIKKDESFQIIIDDKVFNNGLLKFSYSEKDLAGIPQLKTN